MEFSWFDSDVAQDYGLALIGGGVPSTFHLAHAIYEGDSEAAMYYAKLELAVLATQYSILRFLNWYQGPKYAISFPDLHHGMSFFRSRAISFGVYSSMNPVIAPIAAVAGSVAYEKTVNEFVRDVHPSGSSTPWWGPFGSGFGSVV